MTLRPSLLSFVIAFGLVLAASPGVHTQSAPAAIAAAKTVAASAAKTSAAAAAPATTPAAPAPAPVAAAAPVTPPAATNAVVPVLEPQGYTYSPDGRRDPFISLLRRGSEVPAVQGVRAGGLSGLETGEVTLKGTVATHGEFVGIVLGVDSKTYIVKAGDRLLDGTIRIITQDSLVITQQVNDPLSLEKEREVRKLLRQTEEAK